jgi:hypothetical protein
VEAAAAAQPSSMPSNAFPTFWVGAIAGAAVCGLLLFAHRRWQAARSERDLSAKGRQGVLAAQRPTTLPKQLPPSKQPPPSPHVSPPAFAMTSYADASSRSVSSSLPQKSARKAGRSASAASTASPQEKGQHARASVPPSPLRTVSSASLDVQSAPPLVDNPLHTRAGRETPPVLAVERQRAPSDAVQRAVVGSFVVESPLYSQPITQSEQRDT